MKIFGSITELVAAVFRKNSQAITLRPNQGTTYTTARDIQTPPQDANSILVSEDATQVLTNKTLSGSSNTISNIDLTSQVTGILPTANGGTGQNSSAVFPSSGNITTDSNTQTFTNKTYDADGTGNVLSNIDDGNIKSAAGIDAAKIADGSVSNTEYQYLGGVTSDVQTQIDNKVAKAGDTITGPLVMDNQQEIRFREATGSGTNFAAIKAPATLAADYTLTLPVDDGTPNQVLSTDGAGVLSWLSGATNTLFDPDTATDGLVDGTNGLKGFTDGSNAPAGYVGECDDIVVAVNGGPDGEYSDFASATLQPGDYRVDVLCRLTTGVANTVSYFGLAIGFNPGNDGTGIVDGDNELLNSGLSLTNGYSVSLCVASYRVTVPAATTKDIYGKTLVGWVGSNAPLVNARLSWQRVR